MFILNAQKLPLLKTSKKNIDIKYNGRNTQWLVSPEIDIDTFDIFELNTSNTLWVKIASDIDSISFKVKLNNPFFLNVVFNEDTAFTCINYTNRYPNTLSISDKIFTLSLLWSEVKYNFAFFDELTFDWDSLYQSYLTKIEHTKDDIDFYELMRQYMGCLHDGHTSFYRPGIYSTYADYIPMLVRYFNDTLYITDSRIESIPVGSKIVKINNFLAEEYMNKYIFPYVESNYPPTQKMLAASELLSSRKLDHQLTITYITPNNEVCTNTLPRNGERTRNKNKEPIKERAQIVDIKWLENNFAILALNSFAPEKKFIELFDKIKDTLYSADGLIIDLRKNSGGSTNSGWHVLKHILQDSCFLNFAWQTRVNNGVYRANGNWLEEYEKYYNLTAFETEFAEPIVIEDSIKRFNFPIVVLISHNTCSAAEDFLIILAERTDKPLFIGQPTFGSTGSPLIVWDLPNDIGFARICARRVLYPYSLKPFNAGIEPDILVTYTFEEWLSGKDKDLEIAISTLSELVKKNNYKK